MGQGDILEILKKTKRWWNSDELARVLKQGRSKIPNQCNKLVQYNLLEVKIFKKGSFQRYYWRHKSGRGN